MRYTYMCHMGRLIPDISRRRHIASIEMSLGALEVPSGGDPKTLVEQSLLYWAVINIACFNATEENKESSVSGRFHQENEYGFCSFIDFSHKTGGNVSRPRASGTPFSFCSNSSPQLRIGDSAMEVSSYFTPQVM